jgi:hypothetical protein
VFTDPVRHVAPSGSGDLGNPRPFFNWNGIPFFLSNSNMILRVKADGACSLTWCPNHGDGLVFRTCTELSDFITADERFVLESTGLEGEIFCAKYHLIQRRWISCCGVVPKDMPHFVSVVSTKAHVRYQVLTAASVKVTVFWDVTPCRLVEVYRRFGGACCAVLVMEAACEEL